MVAQEKRGNGKAERRRGERTESQSEKGVVSAISSGIPYKTHGFKTVS